MEKVFNEVDDFEVVYISSEIGGLVVETCERESANLVNENIVLNFRLEVWKVF